MCIKTTTKFAFLRNILVFSTSTKTNTNRPNEPNS